MTLANSNFEEWRIENPERDIFDFNLSFEKMSLDGALFDIEKIKSICKERLAYMNKDVFTENAYEYGKEYSPELKMIIESNPKYFKSIINIERDQEKPRKDYEKYSDILGVIDFMYDEYYESLFNSGLEFNTGYDKMLLVEILEEYKDHSGLELDQEGWFQNMKNLAENRKFAIKGKDFKKNPELYIGTIGDYAEILRLGICAKKNTPNFYEILKILGTDRINQRIEKTVSMLRD